MSMPPAIVLYILALKEILYEDIEYEHGGDETQHEQQHANDSVVATAVVGDFLAHEAFLHEPHYKDAGEHSAKGHEHVGGDVVKDGEEIDTEKRKEGNCAQRY